MNNTVLAVSLLAIALMLTNTVLYLSLRAQAKVNHTAAELYKAIITELEKKDDQRPSRPAARI